MNSKQIIIILRRLIDVQQHPQAALATIIDCGVEGSCLEARISSKKFSGKAQTLVSEITTYIINLFWWVTFFLLVQTGNNVQRFLYTELCKLPLQSAGITMSYSLSSLCISIQIYLVSKACPLNLTVENMHTSPSFNWDSALIISDTYQSASLVIRLLPRNKGRSLGIWGYQSAATCYIHVETLGQQNKTSGSEEAAILCTFIATVCSTPLLWWHIYQLRHIGYVNFCKESLQIHVEIMMVLVVLILHADKKASALLNNWDAPLDMGYISGLRVTAYLGRLWISLGLKMNHYNTCFSGGAAILCLYLHSKCALFHLPKGISNCFPCRKLGTMKPSPQHLVLTAHTVSMVVSFNGT